VRVSETVLPGVLLIEPAVFGDDRGYFLETWAAARYRENGIAVDFVQDNVSKSRLGTLRGLHLQHPHAQGKLVHVVTGEVFDVAVDVRLGSPTFGRWYGTVLSEANKRQLYIPPGYAHGFCVTSPEAIFAHITGLKTVIPSTPYDAKGLLIAAIEDDDPVIFLEPKRLYNGPFEGRHDQAVPSWAGEASADVPDGHYTVPLGKAAIVREGGDATILAYGTMVHVARAGIEDSGVDAELIDLRSIVPLDIDTIVASVKKTGRCIILHEASRFGGFGGELSALVQERCFYHLEAPIERVAGWDTPYPHAFEWDYFPGPARVAAALHRVMADVKIMRT